MTALHAQLLDGLSNVKSRATGEVHTIHDVEGKVVAEVCVGKRATRMNLRTRPANTPKGIELIGKSKTWVGGGFVVTDENVKSAKAILAALLKVAPKKEAAPKPAAARVKEAAAA